MVIMLLDLLLARRARDPRRAGAGHGRPVRRADRVGLRCGTATAPPFTPPGGTPMLLADNFAVAFNVILRHHGHPDGAAIG
jgi:hypothetical protein